MTRKLTLIEYDENVFAGDDMEPAIQFREQLGSVTGQRELGDRELETTDIAEIARRIEDMRVYARVISSSSSESSSSSTPSEELFEHHETGGDSSYTIGQTGYAQILAQTFTPDIAHRISRVELELFDQQGNGLTGDIAIEIKATDVDGLPTGLALAGGTIDAADLNPGHYTDVYNNIYRSGTGGTSYLFEVCFSQDGLHMYSISYKSSWGNYGIHHYILSAAWDITTASLAESHELDDWGHGSYFFFAAGTGYTGIFLKPDGTRLYIVGNLTSYGSYIWRIDLDTPYYIASATPYIAQDLFATQQQYSCWFNDEGTRLFTADNFNDAIFQYNLSTPWDLTTFSSTPSQSTSVSAYTNSTHGVAFSADGLKMQVIDAQNHKILFWNLSTAFNLSGESKDSYEMDISDIMTTPAGCYTKDNGKTFFVCDGSVSALTVHRFDLPALHGDWHSCDLGAGDELAAATQYALCASYADYEDGVSEPEWVDNEDGDDNYAAGTLLRYDGSDWYDS